MPAGLDGVSFAPQLEGKHGSPREWVHSLYNKQYFVRNSGWKLRENGDLYDISNAPYEEKLVAPANETMESRAAREELKAVAERLHPAN